MTRTLSVVSEVAPGVVFQVSLVPPCGHCGELVSTDDSTEHLKSCRGAPEEVREVARAAEALGALVSEPEGSVRLHEAAMRLGRACASADFQKNPLVSDTVLLEDVDAFGASMAQRPWFHQHVRDAALARINEHRVTIQGPRIPCGYCGATVLVALGAGDHLRLHCPKAPAQVKQIVEASYALTLALRDHQPTDAPADELGRLVADDLWERLGRDRVCAPKAKSILKAWVEMNWSELPQPVQHRIWKTALAHIDERRRGGAA